MQKHDCVFSTVLIALLAVALLIQISIRANLNTTIIGLLALLIIAVIGLGGLAYIVYCDLRKKCCAQVKLKKYY